jgi:SAM-dependent methyltransferase
VSHAPTIAPLIDAASACYRSAGRFAWHFARGKLARDPVFAALLAQGLLTGRARILDLGCGQGLLAAWLLAARACHERAGAAAWPRAWPPPPRLESYLGIEINPREAARARHVLARAADTRLRIVHGDIRDVDYGSADAAVILDVLHFIDYAAQESVLARVRTALAPHGSLLLRIGDAGAGARFALGQAVDRAVALLRRRRWLALRCRATREWQALLERTGFDCQALPMSDGTPFANVLLVGQAR